MISKNSHIFGLFLKKTKTNKQKRKTTKSHHSHIAQHAIAAFQG